MTMLFTQGNFSHTWTALPSENPGVEWREGMVGGNGEEGYVTSGAPYDDTFIMQNMWFNFPSAHPRLIPPELPGQLDEARQAVLRLDDTWDIPEVLPDGSTRRRVRTFYYSFHPGMQLRIGMERRKPRNYVRWTNYETAETGVRFEDGAFNTWTRTAFTSRADGVTVIRLQSAPDGEKLRAALSIDCVSTMSKARDGATAVSALRYYHLAQEEHPYLAQVAHYPAYEGSELARGGYACAARVLIRGGCVTRAPMPCKPEVMRLGETENPFLLLEDVQEAILLVASARTHEMGTMEEFERAQSFPLVEELLARLDKVAARYEEDGFFSYEKALAAHEVLHRREWEKASIRLAEPSPLPNEDLLRMQRNQKDRFLPELLQRVWEQARFAQICCSGTSAPRLCGMWTGEWQPGWRGIYTLDANVNLQVSGMNVGHLEYAALGYALFLLRNTPDWAENAKMAYGIDRAIQVSVNSDIDRGMHVEYDNDYPFEYWNAGASWCLLPLYEFWQCFGDREIPLDDRMRLAEAYEAIGVPRERLDEVLARGTLRLLGDVLLPLLRAQANFWRGLCTPEYFTDAEGNARYEKGKKALLPGERYLLIPGYSPENHPLGYSSTLTANATMDISAARDGLRMTVAAERAAGEPGFEERCAEWEALAGLLPDYQLDETGALREWAMKEYGENNNHRHISHLYPAWPAYETKADPALAEAAEQALRNRARCNVDDDTAGHGWMHRALVEARLGHGDKAEQALLAMAANRAYYSSLMTDHDTNRRMGCYCTDTLFATGAALQEMLAFSDTGVIELLPAVPHTLERGEARGLMARTRAEVTLLRWDLPAGQVTARIRSDIAQTIEVRLGPAFRVEVDPPEAAQGGTLRLTLAAGQEAGIRFTRPGV